MEYLCACRLFGFIAFITFVDTCDVCSLGWENGKLEGRLSYAHMSSCSLFTDKTTVFNVIKDSRPVVFKACKS